MSKGGGKSKVVAGVVIGMALGLAVAGGVAWYVLQKNPAEFNSKAQPKPAAPVASAPPVVAAAPVPAAPAAPAAAEPKQQFEFYKVLTDKSGGTAAVEKPAAQPKTVAAPKPAPAPTPVAKDLYFVQAGSFQNAGDAEKLKAKLAFSGFEANIQTALIPDKGTWHRVRLGPYDSTEAGKTITALRQTGIIATQVHAQ